MTATKAPRYKAFISYSHAADGRLAPALQSALQGFTKPWHALRACRVFRDKTTLSVTSALWPSIERALLDTEYFVLLASPSAARSEWVDKEVRRWCEVRSADRFLVVLTEGVIAWDAETGDFDWEKTTALPPGLAGKFTAQPLHLDLRWARTAEHLSRRQPQFLEAVADLSCSLRGLSKDELLGMEVREHRRTRRLIAAVVMALTALTAAAVIVSVQLARALRLAEARRVQARSVAETMVFEVNDSLAGIPEADAARRLLGAKAEALLRALGQSSGDPRSQRALMVRHTQRADDALAAGDLASARHELLEGLAQARAALGSDVMDRERRRDVSACLAKLGRLSMTLHDFDGAEQYFSEDLALTREILARQPDNPTHRNDLAVSLEQTGTVRLARGDRAGAEALLREDVAIMRKLHDQYPERTDFAHGLAVALSEHGKVMIATGDRGVATADYREVLALEQALAIDPQRGGDVRIDAELALAQLKLGDLLRPDDRAAAHAHFEAALQGRRALLAREPDSAAAQREVARALARLGSLALDTDDVADAIAGLEEAIAMEDALVPRVPDDEPLRRDLAVNLYDVADGYLGQARFADAQRALARSLALLRAIPPTSPAVSPYGLEMLNTLRRSGRLELHLEHRVAAAALHREVCARTQQIPDDALDATYQIGLVSDLRSVAAAHHESPAGDRDVVLACALEGLRRLDAVLAQAPTASTEVAELRGSLRALAQ